MFDETRPPRRPLPNRCPCTQSHKPFKSLKETEDFVSSYSLEDRFWCWCFTSAEFATSLSLRDSPSLASGCDSWRMVHESWKAEISLGQLARDRASWSHRYVSFFAHCFRKGSSPRRHLQQLHGCGQRQVAIEQFEEHLRRDRPL